ncbi:MAG: hypothetical protein LLG00_14465 [Planctomycetaceae bacterium]|nr:hypothetical protein [Planctomycetaceae bacterium]
MAESDRQPTAGDRCRLTILDLLLLMFSYALGFGISRCWWEEAVKVPARPPWTTPVTIGDLVIDGISLGTLIAGPIAVVSQWVMRRRRLRLSPGEWLWIVPVLNYLGLTVAGNLEMGLVALMVAFLAQAICAVFGVALALFRLSGEWSGVECRWTEIMGCFVNAVILAAILYSVELHPIVI